MMSELKEHYIELIDDIMCRNAFKNNTQANVAYVENNIQSLIAELTDRYTPSEEIAFIAEYLKSKYNVNIWRLNDDKGREREKVFN